MLGIVSHTRLPKRECGELAVVKLCRNPERALSTLIIVMCKYVYIHVKLLGAIVCHDYIQPCLQRCSASLAVLDFSVNCQATLD